MSVLVSCYHLYAELPLMEKQLLLVISLLALLFTCCVIGQIFGFVGDTIVIINCVCFLFLRFFNRAIAFSFLR